MKQLSTVLLALGLVVVPLAIWFESHNAQTWNNRLYQPEFQSEPSRHTPVHADGTIVPPIISKTLTLTPEMNPVILAAETTIDPNARLTLEAGTILYTHEFATLIVDGKFIINGTTLEPVTITTNEVHPTNQTWNGIVIRDGGQATIENAHIEYGSPAISCLPGSHVTITQTEISGGNLGIFTGSEACSVYESKMRSTGDGIIATNVEPIVETTHIIAKNDEIKRISTE